MAKVRAADIFYFAGFSPSQPHILEPLRQLFIECDRRRCDQDGSTGTNPVRIAEELSRRVMQNELLYIGTCGGAKIVGQYDAEKSLYMKSDTSAHSKVCFNFFGEPGCSVSYIAGYSPKQCTIMREKAIREFCFTITSGAGLAFHVAVSHIPGGADIVCARSFQCSKSKRKLWAKWCTDANDIHQAIAVQIATTFASGPFFSLKCGTWWMETTGRWWVHHACICDVCRTQGYSRCHRYIKRFCDIEHV